MALSQRTRQVAVPLAALAFSLAVLAVALVLVLAPPKNAGAPAVGGPFSLVNQDGKPVTERDFAGRPFLVFFGFTHCPDICPTTLFQISEMLGKMGDEGRDLRALFITVDPERDTTAMMKGYVENFGPTFIGLTGTQEQITQVARAYRVYYQKVPGKDGSPYLMDHSSIVYLLDRNGRFVTHFTHDAKAETMANAVGRLL